ncbi:hypothetical protein COCON_G00165940 [Conger conger]|uniref:Uncharacterized protein n=1 Tax=Conger conger TaxID=82655 RepID=A0A9Q1HTT8_CONCO|nr:hypothetical protein COCON_G00165940 [Conger conger]
MGQRTGTSRGFGETDKTPGSEFGAGRRLYRAARGGWGSIAAPSPPLWRCYAHGLLLGPKIEDSLRSPSDRFHLHVRLEARSLTHARYTPRPGSRTPSPILAPQLAPWGIPGPWQSTLPLSAGHRGGTGTCERLCFL